MPDVVLMDVMMPGLDGPATLRQMRASAEMAKTPVIFLTAKVLPSEVAHFLQLGAIGVIRKPFDPLTLGDEVLALWAAAEAPPQGMSAGGERADIQAEVSSLARSFIERTRGDVARLGDMIGRLRQGDTSALRDIERLSHSIHGTGAIFGYPGVSAAAGSMEAWACESNANINAPGRAINRAFLEPLLEFTQRLARETEAARPN